MIFIDSHKQAAAITSTAGPFSLGAAVANYRTLVQAIADSQGKAEQINIGAVACMRVEDQVDPSLWEVCDFTIGGTLAAPTLTRLAVRSSSAGSAAPVTFSGNALVFSTVDAAYLASVSVNTSVTTVVQNNAIALPLTQPGTAFMSPVTVAGALTLTPAANAVRGAVAYLALTADGSHVPDTTAFTESVGSAGYDNRNGIVNYLQAFYDGVKARLYIDQDANAVPVPIPDTTAPVMAGTLASSNVNNTGFTLTWSAASDNVAVTGYEYSIDGGNTYTPIGNVLTKAVTGLAANTVYTCRVRAFDAAGYRATPLTLNVTTASAADGTAPQMVGTLATSNVTSSGFTMTWSAATDNVAATGYEASTNGGGTYTDIGNVLTITETGLAASTTYQLDVRAYDAAGNRATPISASVTTAAAAPAGLAYGSFTRVAQTGSNPNTYAGSGAGAGFGGTEGDAVLNVAFQAGTDGTYIVQQNNTPGSSTNECLVGVDPSNATGKVFPNMAYSVVGHSSAYAPFTGGTSVGNFSNYGAKAGNQIKVVRSNSSGAAGNTATLTMYATTNGGSTWEQVYQWANVSNGVLYVHMLVTGTGAFQPVSQTGLA